MRYRKMTEMVMVSQLVIHVVCVVSERYSICTIAGRIDKRAYRRFHSLSDFRNYNEGCHHMCFDICGDVNR